MMRLFLLFCFALIGSSFELAENDRCFSNFMNTEGICSDPRKCEHFKLHKHKLSICSFNQRIPIVCCPSSGVKEPGGFGQTGSVFPPTPSPIQNRFTDRISMRKCNEYAAKIKKTVEFSALSIGSTSQNADITACEIGTGLIVGGQVANPGEFPHMAALGYPDFNGGLAFKCAGSLISDLYVLSAAHCAVADRSRPSVVRLGDLYLGVKEQNLPEIDVPVASFTNHPNYNKESRQNDIALVKMSRPVTFTNSIRPACLWQKPNVASSTAIATGWGATEFAGQTSDAMMKVTLDILDTDICVRAYDDGYIQIDQKQICSGVLKGGRDTCQGDSGGPLQIVMPENKCMYGIVGITSYGIACGERNAPSIYTRVSAYLDWIDAIVFV